MTTQMLFDSDIRLYSIRRRRHIDNILTFMFSSFDEFCRSFETHEKKKHTSIKTGSFDGNILLKLNLIAGIMQQVSVGKPFALRSQTDQNEYFIYFLWDLMSRFSTKFQSIVSLNKLISVDCNDSIIFMIYWTMYSVVCTVYTATVSVHCKRLLTRNDMPSAVWMQCVPNAERKNLTTKCFQNKYTLHISFAFALVFVRDYIKR